MGACCHRSRSGCTTEVQLIILSLCQGALCLVPAKGKEHQQPRGATEPAGLAASGGVKSESPKGKEGRDRGREREGFVNRKADV